MKTPKAPKTPKPSKTPKPPKTPKTPKTKKGKQSIIKQYEYLLNYNMKRYGEYRDKNGVRFLIAPLYIFVDDIKGALNAFKLFEKRFPDERDNIFINLMWALALYKDEQYKEAEIKLIFTMLSNLFLFPYIFRVNNPPNDQNNIPSKEDKIFDKYIPPDYLCLWDYDAMVWAKSVYFRKDIVQIRHNYMELDNLLSQETDDERRTELSKKLSDLKNSK